MVSTSTTEEIFTKIREDPSNLSCIDCSSSQVEFASISHGSFICSTCADLHKALGPNISFVKPISDSWSIRQLKIMTAGGNSTLNNFFSSYLMPRDSTIDFKYNTLAAKYYREMLKVMAEGESCTMATPSIDEGLMLVPESPSKPLEARPEPVQSSYVGSLFGSALNIGKSVYGKVSSFETYKTLESKVVENASKVGENLKWGRQKGAEIAEKGKETLIWGKEKSFENLQWGTQKGFENLEWGTKTGVELGSQGVEILKKGAKGVVDGMTTAAAATYEKVNLGERSKKLKEDTFGLLSALEKNTLGRFREEEKDSKTEASENN